ncbi:MAG: hypothetical protein LUQ50_13905 [Methanospirillum sp.]|nr:hypothetical protein [Methanospirillum sp.]MDD1730150.1 hypothetical protein [Methanospirillum sp.]
MGIVTIAIMTTIGGIIIGIISVITGIITGIITGTIIGIGGDTTYRL